MGGSCRRLRRGVLVSEIEGMELSLREPVPCTAGETWLVRLGLAGTLGTLLQSLAPLTEGHWRPLCYKSCPLKDAGTKGD